MPPDSSTAHGQEFIPALSFRFLTPWYDQLLRATFPELELKRSLVQQVGDADALLDLGCGTGTLMQMLRRALPTARITGIDIDPAILTLAQEKLAGQDARFVRAGAAVLPFAPASFGCVVSSLMFHHLKTADKQAAFAECHRVLRPGGLLLVADFAAPLGGYAKTVSLLVRLLEQAEDNVRGRLPALMAGAGFVLEKPATHFASIGGTLSIYPAIRP